MRSIRLRMENDVELTITELPRVYDSVPRLQYSFGSLKVDESYVYALLSEFTAEEFQLHGLLYQINEFETEEVQ